MQCMKHIFLSISIIMMMPFYALALTPEMVEKISDQSRLQAIALSQEDDAIREVAIARIENQACLAQIAKEDCTDFDLCLLALARIKEERLLVDIAKNAKWSYVRGDAVDRLHDETTILEIFSCDENPIVRGSAIERYFEIVPQISQAFLKGILQKETSGYVRSIMVHYLEDKALLAFLSIHDPSGEVRYESLSRLGYSSSLSEDDVADISQEDVLIALATSGEKSSLRKVAVQGIHRQEVLAQIAKADDDSIVCEEAIRCLDDAALIVDVLKCATLENVRCWATYRCGPKEAHALLEVAQTDVSIVVRMEALRQYVSLDVEHDVAALKAIFEHEANGEIRAIAMLKINDASLRVKAALTDPYGRVRETAIASIEAIEVLEKIALDDPNSKLRRSVISNVSLSQACLLQLSQPCQDEDIRIAAIAKLEPSPLLKTFATEDESLWVRAVALAAFKEEPWAQASLIAIVTNAAMREIREEALQSIMDQSFLMNFVQKEEDVFLKEIALKNIKDLKFIQTFLEHEDDSYLQKAVIKSLKDPSILLKIATTHDAFDVRVEAAKKLEDKALSEAIFFDIAKHAPSEELQIEAINELTSQAYLAYFVDRDRAMAIRFAAVIRIKEPSLLFKLSQEDPDENVRSVALSRYEWYRLNAHDPECPLVHCIFCP